MELSILLLLVATRPCLSILRDREIYLWHMWEADLGKPIYKGEPAFMCGATVLLAAIPVALSLGYREFHFFGIDSSFESIDEPSRLW